MPDAATLALMANKLRRHSMTATTEAGSGHPTTCLSCAEIMSALFFHEMRWDPKNPATRHADAFVLSKGHAAPILWAALKESGAIQEDLLTLRKLTSPLEGHPTPLSPWVRVATGSLGQGLSCAVGMAVAKRLDSINARVYCLMGDGETAEGSVWEAAWLASHYGLDNLCAIVDVNAQGQSGPTLARHDLDSFAARFAAFGWNPVQIDGHKIPEVLGALGAARAETRRPTVILARTDKGHGISFLQGKPGWHGKPLKKDELAAALSELGDTSVTISVPSRPVEAPPRQKTVFTAESPALAPAYTLGQEVATREAYGSALVKLGQACSDVVVLDGDVKNSTFSEKFKAAFPDRFFECFIAEQNMVGSALGFATEGKIPFASTFACFLTRAADQIRMAGYSRPKHLILCGSHVGVSIGEDGPSQMGLEDIALARAVFGSTVLYPADAVASERLTVQAALTDGIVYLRTSRPKTKVLYPASEMFPIGGSKTLRSSGRDAVTICAAGVTLYEALSAHETLAKDGIAARVIDVYSVKPLDVATLRKAAAETKVLVVEDHGVAGGLGEAIAGTIGKIEHLAVREIPRSGTPKELMQRHGVDAAAIVSAARRLAGR